MFPILAHQHFGDIPWQALLDKAPSKRGTEAQRKRTQVLARSAKSQSGSQRGKRINYFSEAHQPQVAYQEKRETLKSRKPRRALTCILVRLKIEVA